MLALKKGKQYGPLILLTHSYETNTLECMNGPILKFKFDGFWKA